MRSNQIAGFKNHVVTSICRSRRRSVHEPSMYLVLISVILKHFLCSDHGNLVFQRGDLTYATLLASYWSDPGNQVGTHTGAQLGANGTTCLLGHHTLIQHTPLDTSCNWYTYSRGFTYYSTYQRNMAEGGDPPRHGAGRGRGKVGTYPQPQLLDSHSS